MPNLIVIMFNLMYPVGFLVRVVCVRERECVKTQGKVKSEKFSRVAHEKPSRKVKHVPNI